MTGLVDQVEQLHEQQFRRKWLGRILWFLAGVLSCYTWFSFTLHHWRITWFLG